MGGGGGVCRGRGGWLGPPSSQGPPMVPAEAGPKFVKLKSLGLKAPPQTLEGEEGGGGGGGWSRGGVRPLLLRCTVVLIHPWGGGVWALRSIHPANNACPTFVGRITGAGGVSWVETQRPPPPHLGRSGPNQWRGRTPRADHFDYTQVE